MLEKVAIFNIDFPPCPTAHILPGSLCYGFYKKLDVCPKYGETSRDPATLPVHRSQGMGVRSMSLPASRVQQSPGTPPHRDARRRSLVIVAASATACIFDQSDYKGGGRLDKGATAKPAEPQRRPRTTDRHRRTPTEHVRRRPAYAPD